MTTVLGPELSELRALARRVTEEHLVPLEASVPDSGDLDPSVLRHLQEVLSGCGLWALGVPTVHGGQGASTLAQIVVVEELSRSLLGMFVVGRMGEPLPVLFGATPEQQERYLEPVVAGERLGAFALTEPTGGSDPVGNMRTTARRDGVDWVINGRKCFVSLGQVADHVVVFARTGASVVGDDPGITAFIVDRATPGCSVVRTIATMGSLDPAELDFHECTVPDANRIGPIGGGMAVAQAALGGARLQIGARALGAGARLLGMALDHVGTRRSFGTPLDQQQGIQWMLADCAIDLETCRAVTYDAADRYDRGRHDRVRDSMVKIYASEALGRVADRVLQLFGGWGYARDLPVERFYRDARMWRIVEGPNEVHRVVIGRALLRHGIRELCDG